MLIKLTGVSNPDLNGGNPAPVYIDASRVLLITPGYTRHAKIAAADRHREIYDRLREGAEKLSRKVGEYVPDMADKVALEWLMQARAGAAEVNEAYQAWARAGRQDDFHPWVECTEVQLACGTALEHGVMLTRVWVTESADEVHKAVQEALSPTDPRAALSGLPR